MFHKNVNINEDAIFIADSHYNSNRKELKAIVHNILNNHLKTSQLFLMGDIFDFLSQEIMYFKNKNEDMINLINLLSKKIEIIYLEGNHDFNLKTIFPNITILSRDKQPLVLKYKNKKIALSHGDIFTPLGYDLYSKFIRNNFTLLFLNFIDINNWLTKKIDNWLLQKDICSKCNSEEIFVDIRINLYKSINVDKVIEGHFHYGINSKTYVNIPSLACSNKFYSIKGNDFICHS